MCRRFTESVTRGGAGHERLTAALVSAGRAAAPLAMAGAGHAMADPPGGVAIGILCGLGQALGPSAKATSKDYRAFHTSLFAVLSSLVSVLSSLLSYPFSLLSCSFSCLNSLFSLSCLFNFQDFDSACEPRTFLLCHLTIRALPPFLLIVRYVASVPDRGSHRANRVKMLENAVVAQPAA